MPLFLGLHGSFLSDINIDITTVPPPSAFTRGSKHWHWTTLSNQRRELPVVARGSSQGETGCAGSLQSQKGRCLRHQLPASAAPMVFSRYITLRPSSKVAGKALPAAGGGDREASSEGQQVVRGRCLPESIRKIFWIDIELGKNILQCTDESIYPPLLWMSSYCTIRLCLELVVNFICHDLCPYHVREKTASGIWLTL